MNFLMQGGLFVEDTMTPRERVLAAIGRKPVDRVPTDYWGTAEATERLLRHVGAADAPALWATLGIDKIIGVAPAYVGPALPQSARGFTDFWGVQHKTVSYGDGLGSYSEMVRHPLADAAAIDDIETSYQWPQADWFDFSGIASACREHPLHAIEGGYMAPFYMYTNIRGLEKTLTDLALQPELAHYIIGKICAFLEDYHRQLFEAADGAIDIAQVTDDFGTQTGLMISLDMFEEFFAAPYQRLIGLVKEHDVLVFHHDDGAIMPLIPRLVDLGIDILNPIQWHLPGMELQALKDRFGSQICFHGGIDNQHVLPFGSQAEVEAETAACLETLVADGTGYILAPCHNVQANTPPENVVRMYETARRWRF